MTHAERIKGVLPAPKSDKYLVNMPGYGGSGSGDFENVDEEKITFIDGEQDLSDIYEGCIESSGYFSPDPITDPGEESVAKQQLAEASNRWAQCARENGLPGIKDTQVVVDNWKTRVEVVVPGSVNLDQFKAVLSKCPPLDPNRDPKHGNMYEDGEAVPVDPKITFDLPVGDPVRDALEDALADAVISAYENA